MEELILKLAKTENDLSVAWDVLNGLNNPALVILHRRRVMDLEASAINIRGKIVDLVMLEHGYKKIDLIWVKNND